MKKKVILFIRYLQKYILYILSLLIFLSIMNFFCVLFIENYEKKQAPLLFEQQILKLNQSLSAHLQISNIQDFLNSFSCEIYRDNDNIPHIKAQNKYYLYTCLGIIHTRDRGTQMDHLRKMAYGQKSLMGGFEDIKSDFFMHLMGLKEKSIELSQNLKTEHLKILEAYSLGVNLGFKEQLNNRSGYEFEISNLTPSPWQPSDTIALLLLQSLEQTKDNFLRKIDEQKWITHFGYERAKYLFAKENIPWLTTILKNEEIPNISNKQSSNFNLKTNNSDIKKLVNSNSKGNLVLNNIENKIENSYPSKIDINPKEDWGSNSWVIDSKYTLNNRPLLANDPHLSLKHPPFWHLSHLESENDKINVFGSNVPGIPVFANGSNLNVSWGITNSYLTAGQLYLVNDEDLTNSKLEITNYRPLIWIKMGPLRIPFFFKTYSRVLKKWPILPMPIQKNYQAIYHWSSLDLKSEDMFSFFDLLQSESAFETDKVLGKIFLNSWNFVFADTKGNIGYRSTGLIHNLNQTENYKFGIPTKTASELEFQLTQPKYLSPTEMPQLLNPSRGFIVTANNSQWSSFNSKAPTPIAESSNSEFRAYRIEELIKLNLKKHDLKLTQKIQCDVQAQDARVILPLMMKEYKQYESRLEDIKVLNLFENWNYNTNVDCKPCFLYRRWMDLIYKKYDLNVLALFKIVETWDKPNKANARFQSTLNYKDLFLNELVNAHKEYLDYNKNNKSIWGQVHINEFSHLWGAKYKSQTYIPTFGDEQTVSPGTSEWKDGYYKHKSGASQRLIVEMTTPPQVYSILAGSNLNIENPNLNAQNEEWYLWSQCQLKKREFPLDWSKVIPKTTILNASTFKLGK